jgi:hypothetical protein
MALKFKAVNCYTREKEELMRFLYILAEDDKEVSPEHLHDQLGRKYAAQWVCDEMGTHIGIIIFQVAAFRTGRCLSVVGAAGTCLQAWGEMTEQFRTLAKQANCTTMEMVGRKGFARAFKPHGWTEKHVVIECAV